MTWVTLDGPLEGETLFETVHSLDTSSGVFIVNLNKKTASQHLRIVLTQAIDTDIEIIYNSKHGLLINNEYLDFSLPNTTRLYIILDQGQTLYLSLGSPRFADIIFS